MAPIDASCYIVLRSRRVGRPIGTLPLRIARLVLARRLSNSVRAGMPLRPLSGVLESDSWLGVSERFRGPAAVEERPRVGLLVPVVRPVAQQQSASSAQESGEQAEVVRGAGQTGCKGCCATLLRVSSRTWACDQPLRWPYCRGGPGGGRSSIAWWLPPQAQQLILHALTLLATPTSGSHTQGEFCAEGRVMFGGWQW